MTSKQVIKRLQQEGWYEDRQNGSHKVFRHPDKTGRVVVAVHGSKDIPRRTLNNIYEQAGWNQPSAAISDADATQEEPE